MESSGARTNAVENSQQDEMMDVDHQMNESNTFMEGNVTDKPEACRDYNNYYSDMGIGGPPLTQGRLPEAEYNKRYPNAFQCSDPKTHRIPEGFGSDNDSDSSSNNEPSDSEDNPAVPTNQNTGPSNFKLSDPKLKLGSVQTGDKESYQATSDCGFKGQRDMQENESESLEKADVSSSGENISELAVVRKYSTELNLNGVNNPQVTFGSNLNKTSQDTTSTKTVESNQRIEYSILSEDIPEGANTLGGCEKPRVYRSFREEYSAKVKSINSEDRGTHDMAITFPETNGSSKMNTTQEAQHELPVTHKPKEHWNNSLTDPLGMMTRKSSSEVNQVSSDVPHKPSLSSSGVAVDDVLPSAMGDVVYEKTNPDSSATNISGGVDFRVNPCTRHLEITQVEKPIIKSVPANNSESVTTPPDDDFDIDLFAENLLQLGIQQLLQDSFHAFYSGLHFGSAVSQRGYYRDIEIAYNTLSDHVQSLEREYNAYVCLPNDLLKKYLTPLEMLETKSFGHIPDRIQAAYQQLCKNVIQGYQKRNASIMDLESKAIESLTYKSVGYYTEEMEYIIRCNYIDSTFQRYANEIRKETLGIFREVADLKHSFWIEKYETKLVGKLDQKDCFLKTRNEKYRLESTINTVKNASICEYKKSLEEEKKWRDFNPKAPKALDTLQYIGKSAKAAATQYFQKQCNSKILEFKIPGVTQIICDHERELEEEMSAIFALEVRDVKFKQEEQDRILELKKQDISSTEKPFPAHRQNPGPSSETMSAKGAPVRSHCQESPRPPRNWQLNAFRRCQLVIHFGLYRTLVGIVFPASDEALVLYHIDNCVYFDHPELLLCSEDPACRKYVPSKIPNILITMQPVYIGKFEQVMRLDEMIACLFTAIKLKTELDHKVEISNCVICVPQCLNENQRRVISDGAYIAGLGNASMINDTNAIALAFMLKNELFKGSVTVANTSEGFIDAAYFNFDEGVLYCPGVSGNFFIKLGHNKWYHSIFGVSRSESDEAKKIILQIFKGYMRVKKGSAKLKQYSSLKNVILAGDKPIVNEIREVLNSDYQLNQNVVNHSHVEATYALFGAAYLIALNEDNPEGPIYKRWAALMKEPKSDNLDILRRNLLAQQSKDELLKLTNMNPLGHLSAPSMTYRQQQFILNEKIQVHHAKILMLKKVQYLETRLKINPGPGVTELRDLISSIRYDIETLNLTTEKLCDYDINLDVLYDKVHI